MIEVEPLYDAVHPSGHILFRSSRGGYLHSVVLADRAMDTDAQTLADGILLVAAVSYLKALMQVRQEIVTAGYTPSGDVPTRQDLELAQRRLRHHRLQPE